MHSFEHQAEVPLVSVPGYMEWSERKLGEGESAALISTLDARAITVRSEEAADLDESFFDGLLEELREQAG